MRADAWVLPLSLLGGSREDVRSETLGVKLGRKPGLPSGEDQVFHSRHGSRGKVSKHVVREVRKRQESEKGSETYSKRGYGY